MIFQNTFRRRLTKLIFPLAYVGFFAVQFYINFDTALSGSKDRYQIIKCRIQNNPVFSLQKAQGDHPVKTKFRLNKRFQPAVIAALSELNNARVIHYIKTVHLFYVNPGIADPLLDIRLLRGPPFDALSS